MLELWIEDFFHATRGVYKGSNMHLKINEVFTRYIKDRINYLYN